MTITQSKGNQMKTINVIILLASMLASSKTFAQCADNSCTFAYDIEQPVVVEESKYTQEDLDCLYKAVYNETRGSEKQGASLVVATILNRQQSPLFPKNVCAVVYQKAQFTNVKKVNPNKITDKTKDVVHKAVDMYEKGLLNTSVLFFHADYVRPSWSYKKKRVTKIGNHIFYR